MHFQEIAVFIIVAAAAIYLFLRTRNSLRAKDCNKGCGCAEKIPVKNKDR
jgi:hypothetical protein